MAGSRVRRSKRLREQHKDINVSPPPTKKPRVHDPREATVRFSTQKQVRFFDHTEPPDCVITPHKVFHADGNDIVILLKKLVISQMPNRLYDLERLGVRFFSTNELEKFYSVDDIGLRTLLNTSNAEDVLDLASRDGMLQLLQRFIDLAVLKNLSDSELKELLECRLGQDMEDAESMRDIMITKELSLRGLDCDGDAAMKFRRLYGYIAKEQQDLQQETSKAEEALREIETLSKQEGSLDMLRARLIECLEQKFRQLCSLLDLNTQGSLRDLWMRLELNRQLHELAKAKFVESKIEDMTKPMLRAELQKRNFVLPSQSTSKMNLIHCLRRALVEEAMKFPMKYEFGSSSINLEDIAALEPEFIQSLASELDEEISRDYTSSVLAIKKFISEQSTMAFKDSIKEYLQLLCGDKEKNCDIDTLAKRLIEHWEAMKCHNCHCEIIFGRVRRIWEASQ